jgi:hypothetical protein
MNFNKSVHKDNEKVKEQYYTGYNLDTDSEVEGLIYYDADISTTVK